MMEQQTHEPMPALEPAPHAASLEFSDADGIHWHVVERHARHDPGAHGDWCLIFCCDGMVRRVWDYPIGWRELSPAALLALSWNR